MCTTDGTRGGGEGEYESARKPENYIPTGEGRGWGLRRGGGEERRYCVKFSNMWGQSSKEPSSKCTRHNPTRHFMCVRVNNKTKPQTRTEETDGPVRVF